MDDYMDDYGAALLQVMAFQTLQMAVGNLVNIGNLLFLEQGSSEANQKYYDLANEVAIIAEPLYEMSNTLYFTPQFLEKIGIEHLVGVSKEAFRMVLPGESQVEDGFLWPAGIRLQDAN